MRRVSKACSPCSLAHSACDRVRPCQRCVSQGKADKCVDVSTGRRRGRPPRQPSEDAASSPRGVTFPKLEPDDHDSHHHGRPARSRDDDDDGYEHRRVKHPRSERGNSGDEGDEDGEEDVDDDDDDGNEEEARHVAKRPHLAPDPPVPVPVAWEREAMTQLLQEQRGLIGELRAMRSEIAEVRQVQTLHEQYFDSIMPLIGSSGGGRRSNSNSYSSASSPPSSSVHLTIDLRSSSSPTRSPEETGRRKERRKTASTSPGLPAQHPTFLSLLASDPPASSAESAFMSVLGWDYPAPPERDDGNRGEAPFTGGSSSTASPQHPHHHHHHNHLSASFYPPSQPQHQSSRHHHHLHQDYHNQQQEHQQTQRQSSHSDGDERRMGRRYEETMAGPLAPVAGLVGIGGGPHSASAYLSPFSHLLPLRVEVTGLYQKDVLIPSHAYDHRNNGFNVPLAVRLEMLAHLPFLSHYNITSTSVPFAIADPRQPIVACRAKASRRPGEEIRTELIYVSPSFADLIRASPDEMLGASCMRYLGGGDESMNKFLQDMAPWVTMRPVLRGRLTAFRKDGSSIPIQVRTQMFYNDEGYFVQCVTAVEEVEWPAPRPPPTLLSRSIYDQLDQPGPRVEDFASPPYAY